MRGSTIFLASALFAGALAPLACTQNFNIFEPSGTSTSTGTGGAGGMGTSTTSTSTSTSAGGGTSTSTGTGMDCMPGDACSDMNTCTDDSCDMGKCVHKALADGLDPNTPDVPKDCQKPVCMAGTPMLVPDDGQVPDAAQCGTAACMNGMPMTGNQPVNTPCGNNLFCDGNGACVGCTMDSQCGNPGTCKSATCDMGTKQCQVNDSSAGTPCNGNKVCDGGGSCVDCNVDGDCKGPGSKACITHVCKDSCGDGLLDGKETDVDCGGPCQANCNFGQKCNNDGDCKSDNCGGGTCQASCNDGVKNQGESDIDCGGPNCNGCPDGKACVSNNDCQNACVNNVCGPAPTCSDGVQNQMESDIDCGGPNCNKCVVGKSCGAVGDCSSAVCTSMKCAPNTTCTNGMKNVSNGETDVDCGGPNCNKCGVTKGCTVNGDCGSNVCTANACVAAAHCSNAATDGGETDLNCGGLECSPCAAGKMCLVSSDCTSNNCMVNICQ